MPGRITPLSELERRTVFDGDLGRPDPIPESGIDAAVAVMRDGRLFRYGEDRGTVPEAALLEEEFAAYAGRKFCVAVNSGGCSMFLALKAAGHRAGDKVLVNAFTLAPVPGAIQHAGGEAVLVDIDARLVVDIDDLDRKAAATGARFFLLSYMRGHIPDMDAVMAVCRRHDLIVIEDCAHTMGAGWDGRLTGGFGAAGCFSTQTFKHMNSGEGGLIVTDDDDLAARAILMSGSYMLYGQHRSRPDEAVFERHRYDMPNCSMRMSNLVAAVLRAQMPLLDARNEGWRTSYRDLEQLLSGTPNLKMPPRPAREEFVPSSLQFFLDGLDTPTIEAFLAEAGSRGVHVKWFGKNTPLGFTSRHDHWRYLSASNANAVPRADEILRRLCDIRLPAFLEPDDRAAIAAVLDESMRHAIKVSRGEEYGEETVAR